LPITRIRVWQSELCARGAIIGKSMRGTSLFSESREVGTNGDRQGDLCKPALSAAEMKKVQALVDGKTAV